MYKFQNSQTKTHFKMDITKRLLDKIRNQQIKKLHSIKYIKDMKNRLNNIKGQ